MKLNLAQQRALVMNLPQSKLDKLESLHQSEGKNMKGEGLKDVLEKVKRVLGPIALQIGTTVLKEIALRGVRWYFAGAGLKTPGGGLQLPGRKGSGLQLPGKPPPRPRPKTAK